MTARLVLLLSVLGALSPVLLADPSLDGALALFHAKRVPEAREQFAAIVAREPRNPTALHYLGQSELKMQRREAAVDTLAKAADLAPDRHEVLADYGSACLLLATERGVSFSAMSLARRGRDALEQAVKLSPDVVAYREGLVQFYTRAPSVAGGSFPKAYAHIEEISRRDPTRGTVLKANALCSEERYDEALTACDAFLRDHPDSYLALYTIGRIASETGRELARGEASLRRCLQLVPQPQEPDHAGAWYRLGMVLEKANRLADARLAYESALREEPSLEKAATALARLKS